MERSCVQFCRTKSTTIDNTPEKVYCSIQKPSSKEIRVSQYPFRGPCFSIGETVRLRKESVQFFSYKRINGHSPTCEDIFIVRGARTQELDIDPDGMPHSEDYSHQLIIIEEFGEKEFPASHFE